MRAAYARLAVQVEHGITEMVSGLDLVHWMLQLGVPGLPEPDLRARAAYEPSGWAIEVRRCTNALGKCVQCMACLLSHTDKIHVVACSGAGAHQRGGPLPKLCALLRHPRRGQMAARWNPTGLNPSFPGPSFQS